MEDRDELRSAMNLSLWKLGYGCMRLYSVFCLLAQMFEIFHSDFFLKCNEQPEKKNKKPKKTHNNTKKQRKTKTKKPHVLGFILPRALYMYLAMHLTNDGSFSSPILFIYF